MKLSRYSLCTLLSAGLLTAAFMADAALTVVGDLGGESTAPLFEAINPGPQEAASGAPAQPQGMLSISDMLPVTTPEMSPGPVAPRPLNLPGMPPVFILGDDPASLLWLQQHAAALSRTGATGLVVSVNNADRLAALRQQAPGITLVPVRGGDLSHRLQLIHYPALITATGISQ